MVESGAMQKLICLIFGHKHHTKILYAYGIPRGEYQRTDKRISCLRCGEASDWAYLSQDGRDVYALPLDQI